MHRGLCGASTVRGCGAAGLGGTHARGRRGGSWTPGPVSSAVGGSLDVSLRARSGHGALSDTVPALGSPVSLKPSSQT